MEGVHCCALPGFTIVATLTLALGIGATTAMFSVVNGILLRPLPYPEQDRLIELVHEARGVGISRILASPAVYFGYRDHSRTFEAVGLWDWDTSPVTVTGAGEPESVRSVEVTHEVLGILGATPVAGPQLQVERRRSREPRRQRSFPMRTGSAVSGAPIRSGGRSSWTASRAR